MKARGKKLSYWILKSFVQEKYDKKKVNADLGGMMEMDEIFEAEL